MFARNVSNFEKKKKRSASSSATCRRCTTSRLVNSRDATHKPDRDVEWWCAIEGILLSRIAELDMYRKMAISSSCRFEMSTFSLKSQSSFGFFLKRFDQTHEPLRERDISGLGGAGS